MNVGWGVAGTGAIAAGFATDLALLADARLVAIGSRSLDRARTFADAHGASNAHGSYEALAADPDVDVVYVATPPMRHERDVLLFLEAGKHVLCVKPCALNAGEAERLVAAARRRDRFLMEAMWSRFLPPYRKLVELIGDGTIGQPRLVEADFGFAAPADPGHRLYDRTLGGGGLLDLGVYPVQLASLILGRPDRVAAVGHIGPTGVDEHVAAVLGYPGGELAVVKAAIATNLSCTARISGTLGVVELPAMMHCPGQLTVTRIGERQEIATPWDGNGLHLEAAEVHRCLAAGELESAVMPLAETVSIMRDLDAIRAGIGLTYPDEHRSAEGARP